MKRRNILVAVALAFGLILSPLNAFADGKEKRGGHSRGSRGHQTEHRMEGRHKDGKRATRRGNNNFDTKHISTSHKDRPHDKDRPHNGQSTGRPGQHGTTRPGGGKHHNSVPRPGSHSTPKHPSVNVRPTPPRPGSGSHHNVSVPRHIPRGYGWGRPFPKRPKRPKRFSHRLPVFRPVLGLTFGSLLNTGLSMLVNTGYNVVGSVNDRIYLSNVAGFGLTWPQVTVYYDSGAMSGALYHYSSMSPGMSRYNSVYRALCNDYGQPVERSVSGGVTSVTWWGDQGYITLQYGPSTYSGSTIYATDLIYGL